MRSKLAERGADDSTTSRRPAALRLLSVLQNAMSPYILYLAISTTAAMRVLDAEVALILILLIAALACFVAWWTRRVRLGTGLAFVACLVADAVWLPFSADRMLVWLLPFASLGVLARVDRALNASLPSEENRNGFKVDAILIPIGLLASMILLGIAKWLYPWVWSIAVTCVVVRVFTMWALERIESNSTKASRQSFVWIVVLAALAVVLGPYVYYYGAWVLAFVAMVLALPFLLVFPKHFHFDYFNRITSSNTMHTGTKRTTTPDVLMKHADAHNEWMVFTVIGLVVLAIVVYWLFIRKPHRPSGDGTRHTAVVREPHVRKWITSDVQPRWLATDNAVRRAYQSWLADKWREGFHVKRSDTTRQFLQRVSANAVGHAKGSALHDSVRDLHERYERVRYSSHE